MPQGETDAVTDGLLHLLGTDASKVRRCNYVQQVVQRLAFEQELPILAMLHTTVTAALMSVDATMHMAVSAAHAVSAWHLR